MDNVCDWIMNTIKVNKPMNQRGKCKVAVHLLLMEMTENIHGIISDNIFFPMSAGIDDEFRNV